MWWKIDCVDLLLINIFCLWDLRLYWRDLIFNMNVCIYTDFLLSLKTYGKTSKYSKLIRDPCVQLITNFVREWTLYSTKCYDWIMVICGNERVTSFANEKDSVLVTSCQCRVHRAANLHSTSFLELLIWKRVIFTDLKIVSRQCTPLTKLYIKCIHNSCDFVCGLWELGWVVLTWYIFI